MSRTITIVTPENIQVTYETAGFASRFVATVIDLFFQFVLILLVFAGIATVSELSPNGGLSLGSIVSALGIVFMFLIIFAYAIFFEMIWGGRTPGKRLLGLRVIRDGGYPINIVSSAIRNILRFIDFGIVPLPGMGLVLFGLPGLLSIFFSPTYKRLGDYAAGTLVIVERGATPLAGRAVQAPASPAVEAFLPYIRNLDRLTVEEYRVVRRFTSRRAGFDLAVQASLGEWLARPLMAKLEIEAPISFQAQFADVLEAIERRYAEERGVL